MSGTQMDADRARRVLTQAVDGLGPGGGPGAAGFERVRAGHRTRRARRRIAGGTLAAFAVAGAAGVTASVLPGRSSPARVIVPAGTASGGPVVTAATPTSAASAGGTSSSQSGPASRPAECATSELRVTLSPASAAAGTAYQLIDFENQGGSTCTMQGYPGISFVDASGNQIGQSAARENLAGESTVAVTLQPGQVATAYMGLGDAYNFPTQTCEPTTAAGLRVFPPDQLDSVVVPSSWVLCASGLDVPVVAPVQPKG